MSEDVLKVLLEEAKPPLTLFRISGKEHPLVGIYSKELTGKLLKRINEGRYSLIEFVEEVGAHYIGEDRVVQFDRGLVSFINLNTKEDLEAVRELSA
jgi:molybdopterin-guanine dinucleotide biosynthesis protein A